MHFSAPTILLVAGLGQMALAAMLPPHPCKAYANKVSKLATCSTASAFCSSYLNAPASFTRTTTKQKTISITDATTVVTASITVTTTVIGSTTTAAASCPATVQKRQTAASDMCGIDPHALDISGACNCILASRTVEKAKTTEFFTATTTTTPTATATAYGCTSQCPGAAYMLAGGSNTSADGKFAAWNAPVWVANDYAYGGFAGWVSSKDTATAFAKWYPGNTFSTINLQGNNNIFLVIRSPPYAAPYPVALVDPLGFGDFVAASQGISCDATLDSCTVKGDVSSFYTDGTSLLIGGMPPVGFSKVDLIPVCI